MPALRRKATQGRPNSAAMPTARKSHPAVSVAPSDLANHPFCVADSGEPGGGNQERNRGGRRAGYWRSGRGRRLGIVGRWNEVRRDQVLGGWRRGRLGFLPLAVRLGALGAGFGLWDLSGDEFGRKSHLKISPSITVAFLT
jgi:hypothetical protein